MKVSNSEPDLSRRKPLFCGQLKPFDGFLFILLDTLASVVQRTKGELGFGMALFRQL